MVKNLNPLRTKHGISQQKLASIIGISQHSINKYENHNIEPDIDTLIRLADYFNVSIDYLVGRTDNISNIPDTPTSFEMKLLKDLRRLSDEQKKHFAALIESCANLPNE